MQSWPEQPLAEVQLRDLVIDVLCMGAQKLLETDWLPSKSTRCFCMTRLIV